MSQIDYKIQELIKKIQAAYTSEFTSVITDDFTIDDLEKEVDFIIQKFKSNEQRQIELVQNVEYRLIENNFSLLEYSENEDIVDVIAMSFNTYIEELKFRMISREYFQEIVTKIPIKLIIFDEYKNIVNASKNAIDFYKIKGSFDDHIDYTVDLPENILSRVNSFYAQNESFSKFEELLIIDDQNRYFDCILFKTNLNNVSHVLFISKDITNEKNAQLEILRATLLGQDIERDRLSKDLHDAFGQKLTAIKMHVVGTIGMDTSSVKYCELIDEILDITSQSVSLIQEICFDLIPAAFEKSSLNAVINELITRSKISGVDFIFSSNHAEIVFENKKYTSFIYRIIQEFVNNSLKYAHAETIYIIIKYVKKTGEFEMNLVDDGIGFDMNTTVFNNGIYNMQQRLNSLNANYEFVSELGKGTKLKFQLNLKNSFKNQSLIN